MARSRTLAVIKKPGVPQPEVKKATALDFKQIMEDENLDPLREAIKVLKSKNISFKQLSHKDRLDAYLTLIKHMYPTLKAVEVDSKTQSEITITIQKFGHLIAGTPESKVIETETKKILENEISEEKSDV